MNKEILISQYIDDELNLDEKITFVRTLDNDSDFFQETLEFLELEKQICSIPVPSFPCLPVVEPENVQLNWLLGKFLWKPVVGIAATAIVVLLFFFMPMTSPTITQEAHRFVVYLPQVNQAKILGTFTDWQPVAMTKIGESGYWTLTMNIPAGEHRYSYLLGQGKQIPDPTVPLREFDDFGGENSVLEVGRAAI